MTYKSVAPRVKDLNKKIIDKNRQRMGWPAAIFIILLISGLYVSAQSSDGAAEPQKKETGHTADQNLRSLARINPSTLAMELTVPLMVYPGRSGNNVPVSFSYSSKVWFMKSAQTWWYPWGFGQRRYVTDVTARYGERSASGWTSSLIPPRIDDELITYNINGKPYGNSVDTEGLDNSFTEALAGIASGDALQNLLIPEPPHWCGNAICTVAFVRNGLHKCFQWSHIRCVGGTDDAPDPSGGSPTPNYMYYVRRLRVVLPDGSSHEFRQSDDIIYCGTVQTGCATNFSGTYLAVEGSGMKLVKDESGSTLYLPGGGKYVFPAEAQSINGLYASEYTDADGNKTTFAENAPSSQLDQKWIDTLGREISDPIPHNWVTQTQSPGTRQITLPGLNGNSLSYEMTWTHLKAPGCETNTGSNCAGQGGQTGGALEDQTQRLFYETRFFCQGNVKQDLAAIDPNFPNEVLFPSAANGVRPCSGFDIERDERGEPVLDGNRNPIPIPVRFNPVVLSEIKLPNGQKYVFKYNRFGEIAKITYPTGSFETFVYDSVAPTSYSPVAYGQTNRGVVERKVYNSVAVLEQRWSYAAVREGTYPNVTYKVTTVAPKGDDPSGAGIKTERFLYVANSSNSENFGFYDARTGLPYEERTYDELGVLRARTLSEFVTKDYASPNFNYTATRDLRPGRSLSIMIEGNQALAALSEAEYDENGSPDASFFAHLNLKQSKTYHYKPVDLGTAQNGTFSQIAALFAGATPATISQKDYIYDANYKARGIVGLAFESRILNPANTGDVLAKTQTVFDEPAYLVADSGSLTGNLANTWVNPNSSFRGRPTTTKIWDKDTGTWIQAHTQYDQYGNVRKTWDASGDAGRFVEIFYDDANNTTCAGQVCPQSYAYPTKVRTPAPDPTGEHGTSEASESITGYDFTTGLILAVTDAGDLTTTADDLVTKTEYNDSLLRPTKVYGFNYAAPVVETIYDDANLTVKVRKQIDAENWDEATTFYDSLGRNIKTRTKNSEGDVLAETRYDRLGRVREASNPYRQDAAPSSILWSKTVYDELGRALESFAPAPYGSTGESLGTTAYSISTVANYVGTVVVTIDASGRKSRGITNALGQLVRIDEATQTGGTFDADLGTLASPNQPTFYTYSPQGKMVKVQQGKAGDAWIQNRYFLYDGLGRLIRVRQPEQEVNPSLTMPDSITGNNQWTAGFAYDILGNLIKTIDANGTITTNTYDNANRVKTRVYAGEPNGQVTPPISFYYDGKGLDAPLPNRSKGKLTKVYSAVSETRYTLFDDLGRLTQSRQITDGQAYTTGYQYNLSGALIQEIYPSGRIVKNEFETDGDLSRIYGRANQNAIERTYANGFSYTPDGRIQRLKLGNGRWESAKFNARLQVTELALGTSNGDGNLWKLAYEYGELNSDGTVSAAKNTGNIAKQTISFSGLPQPFVQTFKYDSLDRLIEARETNNNQQTWKQTFGYDRFGNRNNFTQQGGIANLQPLIDANTNRFSVNQGYSYDKNGNLTADAQNRSFVFDGENKQTKVVQSGQTVGEYFYDGEGKRVKKITNLETTVFVYDGIGKLVAEYSTRTLSPNPTTSYTATDQLDSPRVITDANGSVVSRRDFMPFGEELYADSRNRTTSNKYSTSNEDSVRQRFTGFQKDTETQLDFAEARMYENRHARFTVVDPLLASGKSANPQTFNRYVYVGNNPISRVDPDGLEWVTKAVHGVYVQKWLVGKAYEKAKANDWTDVPLTNGVYRYEGLRNGKVAGIYELRANGSSSWVENYAETARKKAEVERKSQEGGDNDQAKALVNDLGARAPAMMTIINYGALASVGVIAAPVVADVVIAAPSYAFATRESIAIFYTDGLLPRAAQLATDVGGKIIQNTFGGRIIQGITEFPIFGKSFADKFPTTTDKIWNWGSRLFAENVAGRCILVSNGACDPTTVWNRTERPILEFNRVVIENHMGSPPGN